MIFSSKLLTVTTAVICMSSILSSCQSKNDRKLSVPHSTPLMTTPCSSKTQAVYEAIPKVDSLLSEHLKTENIPGMAAGVVCSDTLLWANGYGVWAVDNKRKVTPSTLFRVASITKLFTATAVITLHEKDLLGLDDPVTDHLSSFKIQRPAGTGKQPVTIRHLLTHTSGVPRDSRLTDFSRLYQPGREKALRALPDQELQAPPGKTFAYSNLGYGILGELISEVSDMSYQEYLNREVLAPLEIPRTPDPERLNRLGSWSDRDQPEKGESRILGTWIRHPGRRYGFFCR